MSEQFIIFTQIIFIDLILAGDNAIIIGMVASKFPPAQRKKVIVVRMRTFDNKLETDNFEPKAHYWKRAVNRQPVFRPGDSYEHSFFKSYANKFENLKNTNHFFISNVSSFQI